MIHRPRRLRKCASLREMVRETTLDPSDLMLPLFLVEGTSQKQEISSLPGQYRWSVDQALKILDEAVELGIKSVLLFPAIEESLKTKDAREAFNPKGLLPRAICEIKKAFPELIVFSDVALDPYSSDGHDGIVEDGRILNDLTVDALCKMSLTHAEAGVDFVAPSDMMDGRVRAIRVALEKANFQDVGIMSYTAKYASSFYGPFRDALDSAPKAGDKKTYQMDYRNRKEAAKELALDLKEGADIVMVKPACLYLDVIRDFSVHSKVPVAAYNVSGEYAMIKWAAKHDALNEKQARDEMLYAIKRAGADLIASYFALDFARDYSN
jgi:porphobilinogen synthase